MINEQIYNHLYEIKDNLDYYKPILELTENANYIFIGESTHGTKEFYQIRAEITKKLITEQNLNLIAIEGDWPDTYCINDYILNKNNIKNADDALNGFKRFPNWMWRNEVMVDFINWLKDYNSEVDNKVLIYGLDLYSLNSSIDIIIKYLEKKDKKAAQAAKDRYSCFDNFRNDLQNYGYETAYGLSKSCKDEVIDQLIDLHHKSYLFFKNNNLEEFFNIEQNARLVINAEKYYRSMFSSKEYSWNIRDNHMIETLENISKYFSKKLGTIPKIVIWAHNSHIGDARATDSYKYGQINIGQLAKERYNDKVILIGFLTNFGTVTAASNWDSVAERKNIRYAIRNSYEYFFHKLNVPNFFIKLKENQEIKKIIPTNLLERAIGVIYLPETERITHYFYANLIKQFDGLIYLNKTSAIKPLEPSAIWHQGEVMETFPFGV